MFKSMTAFSRCRKSVEGKDITVEIKSVNNRFFDCTVKISRMYSFLEDKVKQYLQQKGISRGKIDVFVTFENYSDEGKEIIINNDLVKRYVEEFTKIAQENNLSFNVPVTEITKLPDVLTLKNTSENEDVIEAELLECLKLAIESFITMRQEEGSKIKEDLLNRISILKDIVDKISESSTGLIEEYVVKLQERIKEILKTNIVDEARLAQEVVIYADKSSVEEELTRLKSHIEQFKQIVEEEKPVGKKIDFLIQEMNREINTTGSKSGSLDITNLVVEAKTVLEDIREQVQNIE